MLKNITAVIKVNEKIADGIYRMVLHCPEADLKHFVPGQFAHVQIPGHNELLLKRPISINAWNMEAQTVTLVYQLLGDGTRAWANAAAGTVVDAIMPVGRGFNLTAADKNVILIGGGVGIAPLLTVTKKWPEKNFDVFLGYRGRNFAYCSEDFNFCSTVSIASDDGTIGEQGFVTALLDKKLTDFKPDIVLACGPAPMLRSLKGVLADRKIRCQVSMEQRMGCGFGACATCVCGIDTPDGLDYKKVCVEGPVFDLNEVVL